MVAAGCRLRNSRPQTRRREVVVRRLELSPDEFLPWLLAGQFCSADSLARLGRRMLGAQFFCRPYVRWYIQSYILLRSRSRYALPSDACGRRNGRYDDEFRRIQPPTRGMSCHGTAARLAGSLDRTCTGFVQARERQSRQEAGFRQN